MFGILAVFLLRMLWDDWAMLRGDGVRVEAEVVRHQRRDSNSAAQSGQSDNISRNTVMAAPIYRFIAQDGSTHEVPDNVWSANESGLPAIGSRVTLTYLPRAPERATRVTVWPVAGRYAGVLGMMAVFGALWQGWLDFHF